MIRKSTVLALAITTGLAVLAETAKLPLPAPCGKLVAFQKTGQPQNFVSILKAAKKEDAEPAVDFPSDLIEERSPEAGMLYAVFTFQLEKGRSLSSLDYVLENDRGNIMPCVGMGRTAGGFYDFRLRTQTGPEQINLIFICPSDSYEVRLKSAFPSIILPKLGDFVVKARPKPVAPPKPATSPKPAGTAAGSPAAAAPAAGSPAAPAAPAAKK